MIRLNVKVKKLRSGARLPRYGSSEAAGADLCACIEHPIEILPGASAFIPTGLAIDIPTGYAGLVYARSGLACKLGLAPANKVGVIDSDYRGEVTVCLLNHSSESRTIHDGDRIAQLIFAQTPQADFVLSDVLSNTQRGNGGFGSTGLGSDIHQP